MQMSEYFEKVFHNYMFAYRKYHGCAAALLSLTEQWKEELDKHKIVAVAALDLSKAFDCLPHDLILEKLKFYGMDEKSLSLLNSYLTMRFQRVKLEGTFSTWSEVIRGVPQGSILGPLLFNIFMNDLVYAIKESKLTNYADDTKLHYSHKDPDIVETEINKDLDRAIANRKYK